MNRSIRITAPLALMLAASQPALAASKPNPGQQCDGDLSGVNSDSFLGVDVIGNLNRTDSYRDARRYRLAGKEGAIACDIAIGAQNSDMYRAYLGLMRTIHLIEAKDYAAALESARAVPALARTKATDPGFVRTIGASALYLQAEALARSGDVETAEDLAIQSSLSAGMDIVSASRTMMLARLTPRLTPAKRLFARRLATFNSAYLDDIAEFHAWAGDYRSALASIDALEEVSTSFGKSTPAAFAAIEGVYAALAGDLPRARSETARANATLRATRKEGTPVYSERSSSSIRRMLMFIDLCVALAEGRVDEARRSFEARNDWVADSTTYYGQGDWLELRPPVVIEIIRRLNVPGAKSADILRDKTFKSRLAYLGSAAYAPEVSREIQLWATVGAYRRAASVAWDIDGSPTTLLKKPADSSGDYEIASLLNQEPGFVAAEALLLHCALIAKSRGKSGFSLETNRMLQASRVRFGNPGDPGFPSLATANADEIIRELSPLYPQPAR